MSRLTDFLSRWFPGLLRKSQPNPAPAVTPTTTPVAATPLAPSPPVGGGTIAATWSAQKSPPVLPAQPAVLPEKPMRTPALPPLTGDVLRDILLVRATSNFGVPAVARAQAALGQDFWWYVNAYGAGGDYYNPIEHTGQFLYSWSPSWHAIGIGGMSQAMFDSIKPELAALGTPPLA